jgi:hypothetical protein
MAVKTSRAPRAKVSRRPAEFHGTAGEQAISLLTVSEANSASPTFIITNNFNLIEILSCGLVRPQYACDKYYKDPLEVANGWIPILLGELSHEAVTLAELEEPSYPVALRLSNSAAQEVCNVAIPTADSRVVAVRGSLPKTAIESICFRSEGERSEFLARVYEGCDCSDQNLIVSNELFQNAWKAADGDGFSLVIAPNSTPPREIYVLADRIAGGLAAMLAFQRGSEIEALRAIGVLGSAADPALKSQALGFPGVDLLTGKAADEAAVEERLFSAAVAVLRDVDRTRAWDPPEILLSVHSRVTASNMSTESLDSLNAATKYMLRVLRLEADLAPFKPGSGYLTAKALLLTLLRPDLNELLAWDRSQTGSDDAIDSVASFFAGTISGFELLPLEYRPTPVNRLFAEWQSAFVNQGIPNSIQASVGPKLTEDEIRSMIPSSTPFTPARDAGPPIGSAENELDKVKRLGWSDCIVTTIRMETSGPIELSLSEGTVSIKFHGAAHLTETIDPSAIGARRDSLGSADDLAAAAVSRRKKAAAKKSR